MPRINVPPGDPFWSLGKLGTRDPHALWREVSVPNGACSEFYTPKKDIKLYAYSLQTVLGKSIVLFGGFGRQ